MSRYKRWGAKGEDVNEEWGSFPRVGWVDVRIDSRSDKQTRVIPMYSGVPPRRLLSGVADRSEPSFPAGPPVLALTVGVA